MKSVREKFLYPSEITSVKNSKKIQLTILILFIINGLCFSQIDTIIRKSKPLYQQLAFPTALVLYGSTISQTQGLPNDLIVRTYRNEHFPTFKTKIDDYLVFAPVAIAGIAKLSHAPSQSNTLQMAGLYAASVLVSNVVIQPMKYGFKRLRPDNSTKNSFPSGHTTMAFVGAEMVHQEFHNPWLSAVAYTTATGVGAMRVLNNRHWFSDVVVGAGIGLLSTKLTYWAYHRYQKKHGKQINYRLY